MFYILAKLVTWILLLPLQAEKYKQLTKLNYKDSMQQLKWEIFFTSNKDISYGFFVPYDTAATKLLFATLF